MTMDENTRWCDKCGYHVGQEYIEEQECPFWECPLEKSPIVNVGDELHQILGEALTPPRPDGKQP